MSSHFSLFSGGIPTPVFQTPGSTREAQTTYTAPHMNNTLAYGWNYFQISLTTSQSVARGNPAFTFGNHGASPSTSQAHTF